MAWRKDPKTEIIPDKCRDYPMRRKISEINIYDYETLDRVEVEELVLDDFTHEGKEFEFAFSYIMEWEGGYVNDPNDPGGETKYGISQRAHPNVDIKKLTLQQAKDIYRRDYWIAAGMHYIDDRRVAAKIFDVTVNMGSKRATKLVLKTLKSVLKRDYGEPDVIPTDAINILNRVKPDAFLNLFKKIIKKEYQALMDGNPSLVKYKNGWFKRAETLPV